MLRVNNKVYARPNETVKDTLLALGFDNAHAEDLLFEAYAYGRRKDMCLLDSVNRILRICYDMEITVRESWYESKQTAWTMTKNDW